MIVGIFVIFAGSELFPKMNLLDIQETSSILIQILGK